MKKVIVSIGFYPTLLDGKSLLPIFKNSNYTLEDRPLFWHFPGYPNNVWRTGPVSVIQSGPWKLMKFYEANEIKLYNLENDISETHDLAELRPEIRKKLLHQFEQWIDTNNAPLPKRRRSSNSP